MSVTGSGSHRVPAAGRALDGAPSPTPSVLIVDDEVSITETLAYIVEDAGYQPLVAFQGRQALELASTFHPALVLTDLMMPQMNGAELIVALRNAAAAAGHKAPPIVLMSAAGARAATAAEADAVVRKPFDITQVEAVLARYLPPPGSH